MNFEETVQVRIRGDDLQNIKEIIKAKPEKFNDVSHFCRCAIIRLKSKENMGLK